MQPFNPDNWILYLYSSKTMIGTLAQNNAGVVPLSAFPQGSVVNGVPQSPQWLAFETYGLYPRDTGDKELQKRGNNVLVERGEYRIGGRIVVLEFDFNDSLNGYFAMAKALRYHYKYLWLNDYSGAEFICPTPATNAVRIVTDVSEMDSEDAIKPFQFEWHKYATETL